VQVGGVFQLGHSRAGSSSGTADGVLRVRVSLLISFIFQTQY